MMNNSGAKRRARSAVGTLCLAGLAFATFAIPASASANTCQPPDIAAAETFVHGLHDGAKNILRHAKNPASDMVGFISKNVEIERVARYAMGPAWNSASPAQRAEYLELFRITTLRTLASHVTLYDGASYKIAQSRAIGDDEFLVTSTITSKSGKSFGIGWRISVRNCALMANDIVDGGVSLVLTKRQEFASVIARDGVNGLLQRLRVLATSQRTGSIDGSDKGEEMLVDLVLRAAEKLGNSRF